MAAFMKKEAIRKNERLFVSKESKDHEDKSPN